MALVSAISLTLLGLLGVYALAQRGVLIRSAQIQLERDMHKIQRLFKSIKQCHMSNGSDGNQDFSFI